MNNQPFSQINTETIKDCLILLDIDGTMTKDNQYDVDKDIVQKINELKKYNQIYLCSNSRNHDRNKSVASCCGLNYLDTDIRKPSKKILDLIDITPFKRKLVIGDKFLTDGLFAKRIKAEFIKVKRLTAKNDKIFIKFLYWIDDICYWITFHWITGSKS